jgi:5-methyltetrahydrofolate--homocysteine methyltransferase
VKIAPAYDRPVVHVLDASRAVGVAGNLLNRDTGAAFAKQLKREQDEAREKYLGRQAKIPIVSLQEARARKLRLDWTSNGKPPEPSFTGVKALNDVPLSDMVPFIDWSPLFHAWELRGTYPRIFDDNIIGERAKELFADAQQLLNDIVEQRALQPRGVYGFWPASAVGDDIEVFSGTGSRKLIAMFHTLRQQLKKAQGEFNYALADFVAQTAAGVADYIGAFVVSVGNGLDELTAKFEKQHDDYSSIMAKALADRLAEAFAEWLHKKVREEWGYGRDEDLTHEDLINARNRGIRPAPGYPALPDHTEKRTLFDLLQAEKNAGVQLTENYAMIPASSVCGLYLSHPAAKYFSVGKIGRDQIEDYSVRKGMPVDDIERWLSPNLAYL